MKKVFKIKTTGNHYYHVMANRMGEAEKLFVDYYSSSNIQSIEMIIEKCLSKTDIIVEKKEETNNEGLCSIWKVLCKIADTNKNNKWFSFYFGNDLYISKLSSTNDKWNLPEKLPIIGIEEEGQC